MADPQARAKAGLRGLSVPPPPRRATIPAPDPTPTAPAEAETGSRSPTEPAPQPDAAALRKRTSRKTTSERNPPASPTKTEVGDDGLIGRTIGNKRSITVYLTVRTRQALDAEAAETGDSRGVIIMRAMRDGYQALAQELAAQDSRGVGPFPAERVSHRRRGDEPRLATTAILWPDEVAAIQQVATELTSGNVSALVNDALQLRYP